MWVLLLHVWVLILSTVISVGSVCGPMWNPHTVMVTSVGSVSGPMWNPHTVMVTSVSSVSGPMWNPLTLFLVTLTLSMVGIPGIFLYCPWLPLLLSMVTAVDPLILSMVTSVPIPGYACGFCFRPCNRSQNGSHFMLALPPDSNPMMRMSGFPVPRAHDVLFLFTLPARDLLILVTLASARTSGKMPTRPCASDHT